MPFHFTSSLSTERSTPRAFASVLDEAAKSLAGRRPDLVLLFVTPHHAESLEDCLAEVRSRLGPGRLLGCLAQGVIGNEREVERSEAVSLWAASLPGVDVRAGHIRAEETPEGLAFSGLPETPEGPATLLLLGDPYSFPAAEFIGRLEEDRPELQAIGGMASGSPGPGARSLILGGPEGVEILEDGAVGAILSGPVRVRPVVSQGCRPFGKHLVITRADGNLILELGGRPALERLNEEFGALPEEDQQLLRHGLHIGRAIDPSKRQFQRGDFLIRNVVGIDQRLGAIAVADPVRAGQTVQFHLRDARSASEDLDLLLRQAHAEGSPAAADSRGALLFSCNGRGTYLFSQPHHDAGAVRREMGTLPLGGFFAAGELGPVGGRNFLHGFTASLAIIEEAS